MTPTETRSLRGRSLSSTGFAVALLATTALSGTIAYADDDFFFFRPGDLLVSKAVYSAPNIVAGTTQLPPGCGPSPIVTPCAAANTDGTYPFVFNNANVDGSFSVASKIVLDELRADNDGDFVQSLEVPNSTQRHVGPTSDQAVTSFQSKSELSINLSVDHKAVSFMAYFAPVAALDVSNSNTPSVIDATNVDTANATYRVFADVDAFGHFHFTKSNAYSGDNGRAAILNDANGANVHYGSGNAGNGSAVKLVVNGVKISSQPLGIVEGGGAQFEVASHLPLNAQIDPGLPSPVGSFNIVELGLATDKIGKDTNFRGLTVFNNVVYFTKGSGGNGVNTLYFVDTSGNAANGNPKACPNGSGLPALGATLPTQPMTITNAGVTPPATAGSVQAAGVMPYNMCILKGFPTLLANSTAAPPAPQVTFPFGVWFADSKTVYIADEGSGDNTFAGATYTKAAASTTAGLQKYVFNEATGAWQFAYTLQAGLNLGVPYTVKGYPTGNNAASGLPWSPATDGLRNLTGRVNHHDGTATIWAVTSTVSGSGDQGADPNKLVMITDKLSATTLPANESFKTIRNSPFGELYRGVSFTPGTDFDHDQRHAFGGLGCLFDRDDCGGNH
ncbi:hypothetical protein [Bradyrhizobium sp.]|uniref:hypothetical protein n=1 Tax=Bradyrhizobium sp. TaxID=376 RepID=UPI002D2D47ED|nr:hypothetical protein [Bradyrhizobium sp.]HZR72682.1 hypothetical protein [Bradyrhizobium sp.]